MDGQDLSGFEGNDTGMGQGLSYVLPQSRSVGYFMQLANEKAQQARDNAAALQAQQQKANEDYANHLYQFKTPEIANEYTKWLQPKFDDVLNQAAQYHNATGSDPFVNPNFVQKINDLNTVAKSTHQANLRATALATALADKSKNYTPESKQANTDWLQNYYKDPVSNLYTAPPALQERNLDLNDALKLAHPTSNEETVNGYNVTTPNRHNHIAQLQTIYSQPEFSADLQSRGINPAVGDAFGHPNGTGGTIYPTDPDTVNATADHFLQNPNQPAFAQTLKAANIDPADPHAKDKLVDLITRQNAGYGKLYSQGADKLDAQINTKKVANYGEDHLAISEANLDLARQRLELQQEKAAKKASQNAAIDPQDVSQIPYATATTDADGNSTGFNINARNFVPVKSSDVPFGANPDIDLTNGGKPKGITPLSKFSIAGVGDFPLYKNSGGSIQAGTPVSPKYEGQPNMANYKRMVVLEGEDPNDKTKKVNYLMDYNKIPANVANQKSFREAVAKFDNTPVYGTQTPQPTGKNKRDASAYGL